MFKMRVWVVAERVGKGNDWVIRAILFFRRSAVRLCNTSRHFIFSMPTSTYLLDGQTIPVEFPLIAAEARKEPEKVKKA